MSDRLPSRRAVLAGLAATALVPRPLRAETWADGFDLSTPEGTAGGAPLLSRETAAATRDALATCRARAEDGWPPLQLPGPLRLGDRHPAVAALRARLAAGGDLAPQTATGRVFDSYVAAGVRSFQTRHGLTADGAVGAQTAAALAVLPAQRVRQVALNIPRLDRAATDELRYVAVNVPSADIEAVEGGRVHSRRKAVVGQPDRATPLLVSAIHEINFNPYWTVPASIIRKDLIPLMRKDPGYLDRNRIRILDPRGREISSAAIDWSGDGAAAYRFRQDPGRGNSLGQIRINFANDHQVYLHDTPAKSLFGDSQRFHSSGCVRVQDVTGFVAWLLSRTPGWDAERIRAVLASGDRVDAALAMPVPVHFVYITAWSQDGRLQFRDDVYGLDR